MSTITITGSESGLPFGSEQIGPISITGAVPEGTVVSIDLALGDNTVAVPVGATAFMAVTPAGYTGTLTWRSVSGDTGIRMAPSAGIVVHQFDPAALPASLIFHASVAYSTAPLTVLFI